MQGRKREKKKLKDDIRKLQQHIISKKFHLLWIWPLKLCWAFCWRAFQLRRAQRWRMSLKRKKSWISKERPRQKRSQSWKRRSQSCARGKEEGGGRERRHPQFAKKQNVTEPDSLWFFTPSNSFHSHYYSAFVSLCFHVSSLHFRRLVDSRDSPDYRSGANNLLHLSALVRLLWFSVFLFLMGLISKTQSHIPARSN